MNSVTVWLIVVSVTVGTYLMRIAGSLPGCRRLAQAGWVHHVPLAVFLVLAVYAVAPAAGVIPSPEIVISACVVLVLSIVRAPLSVRIVCGTAVYGVLTTFVFT